MHEAVRQYEAWVEPQELTGTGSYRMTISMSYAEGHLSHQRGRTPTASGPRLESYSLKSYSADYRQSPPSCGLRRRPAK